MVFIYLIHKRLCTLHLKEKIQDRHLRTSQYVYEKNRIENLFLEHEVQLIGLRNMGTACPTR